MSGPICIRCKGVPCVCHYVDRLRSGDLGAAITSVARTRMQEAHSPALNCPCPECYRERLAGWEVAQ